MMREIVADMSHVTMEEDEVRGLLVYVENSDLEPEQKFEAAHVLIRILQGKDTKEHEVSVMGQIFGDDFVAALRGSVLTE